MKKIFTGFIVTFTFLVLTSCAAPTKAPENLQRQWMLVEFQDFSKALMMNNVANINLIKNQEAAGRYSAHMGCNKMLFVANFEPTGTANFSNMSSTEMYCDNNMDLETAFGTELAKMVTYSVDGHYLTLIDSNGTQMKFVAADWD